MVLTKEQIEKLRRTRSSLLKAIKATEDYCEKDKKSDKERMPGGEKVYSSPIYSNFINFSNKLLEKIRELKAILHNENTFKMFLQEVGFRGYRQSQILNELIVIINNFLLIMDNFTKLLEKEPDDSRRGHLIAHFLIEPELRKRMLYDMGHYIREVSILIENVQHPEKLEKSL